MIKKFKFTYVEHLGFFHKGAPICTDLPLHRHCSSLGFSAPSARTFTVAVNYSCLTVAVGCWSVNFGVFGDEPQDQQEVEEAAGSTDAGGDRLPGTCEVKVVRILF